MSFRIRPQTRHLLLDRLLLVMVPVEGCIDPPGSSKARRPSKVGYRLRVADKARDALRERRTCRSCHFHEGIRGDWHGLWFLFRCPELLRCTFGRFPISPALGYTGCTVLHMNGSVLTICQPNKMRWTRAEPVLASVMELPFARAIEWSHGRLGISRKLGSQMVNVLRSFSPSAWICEQTIVRLSANAAGPGHAARLFIPY